MPNYSGMTHYPYDGSNYGGLLGDYLRDVVSGKIAREGLFGGGLAHIGRTLREDPRAGIGLAIEELIPGGGFLTVGKKGAGLFGKSLPMDEASRMERARDMGFDPDQVWYHGTTHDFDRFGGSTHSTEGYFGAGHYFTTDPYDARMNYAGEGPDLTIRIDTRAEQIAAENGWNFDDPRARKLAEKELKGENEGRVIEAYLRGDTVNVTGDNPTWLDFEFRGDPEDFMDDAKELVDKKDYTYDGDFDADSYQDALYDKAVELADEDAMYREPTGKAADFIESLQRQSYDYGYDYGDVIAPIQDELYDGGISANRLNELLRNNEALLYAEGDKGGLIGNEVLRQAFYDAGYDNILMDASEAFPGMNLGSGVKHLIANDPSKIRDIRAAFDPAKKDSADLLAAWGLPVAATGLLAPFFYEDEGI